MTESIVPTNKYQFEDILNHYIVCAQITKTEAGNPESCQILSFKNITKSIWMGAVMEATINHISNDKEQPKVNTNKIETDWLESFNVLKKNVGCCMLFLHSDRLIEESTIFEQEILNLRPDQLEEAIILE